MHKIIYPLLLICFLSSLVQAQTWSVINERNLTINGIQDFQPQRSVVAQVSDEEIKGILWSAPDESESRSVDSPARLNLMTADGTTRSFGIVRYDMQQPGLSAKFDNIRTFKGVCLSDPRMRVRLDYTVHGLRAWISKAGQHSYIEHYKRGHKDYKIIYDRNDLPRSYQFSCGVTEQKIDKSRDELVADTRQGACELNTLLLANAANGEYSNFHTTDSSIPDEEEVHSAVVTAINRVNEVYEQDFGVRLILIDNNEDLYYYDGVTDPYTNASGSAMLGENQTNVDNVIGNSNYDVGHVFSTGGGGIASLSSVCSTNNKARGVTGQPNPINDPFSIDYVAHEIGHQMGANHTQNNGCNRNNSTAMEPGSASTIMGYAGICSPNVQNNSDPYFHAISIEEAMNDASNFTCAEEIVDFGNTSPNVTIEATSYTIPASTTFVLDADGTDADGDPLTYCWEQMDNQVATMPPQSTNTSGPAFRSLNPVEDSKRYFPSLEDILSGNNPTWEVLPTVSRDLDFRVTVRDWHDGPGTSDAGCTAEADVTVTVDGNSGPFVVTSHEADATWGANQIETITWDVAGTDVAPVNCVNVEIWFSTDDSFDNPTLLLTTSNDGSADITVPSTITTEGKYMIKGADNIFFDINGGIITIEESDPTFLMTTSTAADTICNTTNNQTIKVETSSVLGYDTDINLSITGLPGGATTTYSSNPVTPGGVSVISVSNLANNQGIFDVIITGQSGSITKTANYQLIMTGAAAAPNLTAPADGASGVGLLPILTWEDLAANEYEYQLSTAPNGGNVIETNIVTDNEVQVSTPLSINTSYFWRVRLTNACGQSTWSSDNTFTTLACQVYSSVDVPILIPADVTNTITSDLTIYDRGVIDDINVVDLVGTHTWMDDLNFSLVAPDDSKLEFWDQPCGQLDDFDINFDDEAASGDFPCPPTDGNNYKPTNPLSFFDTKDVQGIWQLEIFDDFNDDGGELQSWGIEVCYSEFCDLTVSNIDPLGLGSFNGALGCAISGDTIRLTPEIAGQIIDVNSNVMLTEDVHFIADAADNIVINFVGDTGFVIIPGVNVSFAGVSIQSSGTATTIQNSGNLKLTDVNIIHPGEAQISNSANATVEVNGICNIQE